MIFKDIPAQFSSCVWVTACGHWPAAEGADTLLTRFAKSGDFESQSLREGKFAELQQKTTDLLKVGTLREQICKLESWRLAKVEKEKMIVFIGLGKVQWNSEYIYKMY